jgi:DNA-binding response OmpR family regulator
MIDAESPDLVMLDIWMPGIDGIETLKEIKKTNSTLPVIIITGHGNVETAVKATKLGAFDLIEKPLNIDKVIVAINNALNFRRLEEENRYLRKKTIEKHSISGNSEPVQALKDADCHRCPHRLPGCLSREKTAQARNLLPGPFTNSAPVRNHPWSTSIVRQSPRA